MTIIHKANILKYSDGLFLKIGRHIGEQFPDIEMEDRIVDNIAEKHADAGHDDKRDHGDAADARQPPDRAVNRCQRTAVRVARLKHRRSTGLQPC